MSNKTTKSECWQDLKWIERNKYLLNSGHLADCKFVVGTEYDKEIFHCHKWILLNSSPVFERMFTGQFIENSPAQEVRLTDVDPVDFKRFLNYIYYENSKVLETYSMKSLINLIHIGEKYMVQQLKDDCFKFLANKLNKFNAKELITIFHEISLILNESFRTDVNTAVKKSAKAIMTCSAVNDLTPWDFYELLIMFDGVLKEVERFYMIEMYAKSNVTNESDSTSPKEGNNQEINETKAITKTDDKIDTTKTQEKKIDIPKLDIWNKSNCLTNEQLYIMMDLIRFTEMTALEFCDGPGISGLLDTQRKYEILFEITKKGNPYDDYSGDESE